ncbi:MAG: hypothetical protein QG672_2446 [Pseudomonadota bacterium]|nr:hypothetical protein [Pseudomonadota bacterium]
MLALRGWWQTVMSRSGPVIIMLLAILAASANARTAGPAIDEDDAPQVKALLSQAWASETGRGLRRNVLLASALYGQAGRLGSAEGYYRAGKIQLSLARGSSAQRMLAACLLSSASQLGHHAARAELDRLYASRRIEFFGCSDEDDGSTVYLAHFDLDRYVTGLPLPRQRVVALIRSLAPHYGVDARLALAVATVESNLDPWALSPKQAMGVMQLIPATAERFNVRKPFDAEQNIRGGLAYLRWLLDYYRGDVVRVLAAYNAGEKAVDRYGGIPPYMETRLYVARVLGFSGRKVASLAPAPGTRAVD